jgi:hypothetical protein
VKANLAAVAHMINVECILQKKTAFFMRELLEMALVVYAAFSIFWAPKVRNSSRCIAIFFVEKRTVCLELSIFLLLFAEILCNSQTPRQIKLLAIFFSLSEFYPSQNYIAKSTHNTTSSTSP